MESILNEIRHKKNSKLHIVGMPLIYTVHVKVGSENTNKCPNQGPMNISKARD
jgi:hypothetical protein